MLFLAVAFGAAFGGFVQSITGFGSAVMMMTVLPRFFNVVSAAAVSNSICLGMALMQAWHYRKKVSLRAIILPTILYDLASMATISRVGGMDMGKVTLGFGVFLVLLGLYFLFIAKGEKVNVTLPLTIALGLAAGVSDGFFSIGGPFMAIYFLGVSKDHESYLGNIQTHFAINNIITLSTRITKGIYTMNFLPLTAVGLVAVFLGQFFGTKISGKLDADKARRLVYGYVVVSGLITIVQQLA